MPAITVQSSRLSSVLPKKNPPALLRSDIIPGTAMFQRIGRYEILDRIAAGGQGTVYRARDTVLDRVVAVRVINRAVANDYGLP